MIFTRDSVSQKEAISPPQVIFFVLKMVSATLIIFAYSGEAILSCNLSLFVSLAAFCQRSLYLQEKGFIKSVTFEEVIYHCQSEITALDPSVSLCFENPEQI